MRRHIFILAVLSYFFFFFGNSMVSLSNPDEVFYTQTAKEMVRHKSWLVPYLFDQPQFEKPIFLYWLLRLAFIIFGVTNFGARFFPALFALIGVIAVYLLALLGFKNERKAFLSALILMSSSVYVGLGRTVFTDMVFSIFILLALVSFYGAYVYHKRKTVGLLLYFFFSALAVLSKGPLGLFFPGLIVLSFLWLKKDLKFLSCRATLWGLLIFVVVALPWYIFMMSRYDPAFSYEFFYNDHIRRFFEAEHPMNDTWHFYPLSLIWGMLPWSLYVVTALASLVSNLKRKKQDIYLFLACWIGIIFLVCQPAHSKLVSYIFPFFPALALLAGDFIYERNLKKTKVLFWISLITAFFALFFVFSLIIAGVFFKTYILKYLSSIFPIYLLAAFVLTPSGFFIAFVIRRDYLKSAYALFFFIPAIFCIIPIIDQDIEPYVSPKVSCQYLLGNYKIDNFILCSKFFARGVRFYTDKKIAVMNPFGKNFFSPHPIPFLDNDDKVRDFLCKQKVTYCVLKRSSVEDIERQKGEFKIEVLRVIGDEYLVRASHLK
jgi:4-amino-4-deoxy-L-arabinose transferase-like glycosyltransferase